MGKIDVGELAKIPFLDIDNLSGRFLSSLTFYDEDSWHVWIPVGVETPSLMKIQGFPAEGFYFSKSPAMASDLHFHFLDFIAQRASFPELSYAISGLHDDIFNLSASIEKIRHLHATRQAIGTGVMRMAVTEIEYIFSICRSMFDLLQEIICKLWNTIELLDRAVKKKPLPENFSAVVMYSGRVSTKEEIIARFGLPEALAEFYLRNADFFLMLRKFRDNIIHHGSQIQGIFAGDADFLVKKTMPPFSTMRIWRDKESEPNGLFPLSPALNMVIFKTLGVCEEFSSTIERTIGFPSPLVPGMGFFARGFFNHGFSNALSDAAVRYSDDSVRQ